MQFKTLHDGHENGVSTQNKSGSSTLVQNPQLPSNSDAVAQGSIKKAVSKEQSNNDRKSKTVRISPQALDVLWLIVAQYRCSLKNAVDIMAQNYGANVVTGAQGQRDSE